MYILFANLPSCEVKFDLSSAAGQWTQWGRGKLGSGKGSLLSPIIRPSTMHSGPKYPKMVGKFSAVKQNSSGR